MKITNIKVIVTCPDRNFVTVKTKAANMPLYELLGGKSRDGVMVYGHANGGDIYEPYPKAVRYFAR